MGKSKEIKTNVSRLLDARKISYEMKYYDPSITQGTSVAKILNEPEELVYKTLVTVSKNNEHYVFVIPVADSLDLKKASKVAGVKSIDMIPQKELEPLTGYIHGGCSPIGMKKKFKTFFDSSIINHQKIYVSGGKVGIQIYINVEDLVKYVEGKVEDLVLTNEN